MYYGRYKLLYFLSLNAHLPTDNLFGSSSFSSDLDCSEEECSVATEFVGGRAVLSVMPEAAGEGAGTCPRDARARNGGGGPGGGEGRPPTAAGHQGPTACRRGPPGGDLG